MKENEAKGGDERATDMSDSPTSQAAERPFSTQDPPARCQVRFRVLEPNGAAPRPPVL